MIVASLVALGLLALALVVIFFRLFALTETAPFIPVPEEALPAIVSAMAIPPGAVVWDLGCGDGAFLVAAGRRHPDATFVGVEKHLLPRLLARWRSRKLPNVSILRDDFFKPSHAIAGATHVYLYLFPEVLKRLRPRLVKELAPGAVVASCDYAISGLKESQTIDLQRPQEKRGKTLFVYRV